MNENENQAVETVVEDEILTDDTSTGADDSILKNDMREAGILVSEGDQVLFTDFQLVRDFMYFQGYPLSLGEEYHKYPAFKAALQGESEEVAVVVSDSDSVLVAAAQVTAAAEEATLASDADAAKAIADAQAEADAAAVIAAQEAVAAEEAARVEAAEVARLAAEEEAARVAAADAAAQAEAEAAAAAKAAEEGAGE